MDLGTLSALVTACAPLVHPGTAQALIGVESGFNPHAIGVVGGVLDRQPRNRLEAIATARHLQQRGWNFSVGLAQINLHNFARLGLNAATAFEPCQNLRAMQTVLVECFDRASTNTSASASAKARPTSQRALHQALSCYYSGNFVTGFRHGYVHRVTSTAARPIPKPVASKEELP